MLQNSASNLRPHSSARDLPRVPTVRPAWEIRYVRSTIIADAAAVTVACAGAVLLVPWVSDPNDGLLSAAVTDLP